MIKTIESILASSWQDFGFDLPFPRRFHYSVIHRPQTFKVILQCFPDSRPQPLLAIKVACGDPPFAFLASEYNSLTEIWKNSSLGDLAATLPKPFLLRDCCGHLIVIESHLPGTRRLRHSKKRKYLERAANWLIEFHRRTARRERLNERYRETLFHAPLEFALRNLVRDKDLAVCLERHRQSVETLGLEELPLVFAHNTFAERNLLFTGRGIGVIDWETATYPSLPLTDLIDLYTRYVSLVERVPYAPAFRRIFVDKSTPISTLFEDALEKYVASLRIPPSLIRPLIVQYLVTRSFLRHRWGAPGERVEEGMSALALFIAEQP
jgi:thiamine kinase-like enzyme